MLASMCVYAILVCCIMILSLNKVACVISLRVCQCVCVCMFASMCVNVILVFLYIDSDCDKV